MGLAKLTVAPTPRPIRGSGQAESAATTRGCQVAPRSVLNSRGKVAGEEGAERPAPFPRAFRRVATWFGSSVTVLCVNQPMLVL